MVRPGKPSGGAFCLKARFSERRAPPPTSRPATRYKSFEPICQTFKNDQVIVARPDSPFKSAGDLIAATKAKPGGLNYGHPGLATIPHLAMIESRAWPMSNSTRCRSRGLPRRCR